MTILPSPAACLGWTLATQDLHACTLSHCYHPLLHKPSFNSFLSCKIDWVVSCSVGANPLFSASGFSFKLLLPLSAGLGPNITFPDAAQCTFCVSLCPAHSFRCGLAEITNSHVTQSILGCLEVSFAHNIASNWFKSLHISLRQKAGTFFIKIA